MSLPFHLESYESELGNRGSGVRRVPVVRRIPVCSKQELCLGRGRLLDGRGRTSAAVVLPRGVVCWSARCSPWVGFTVNAWNKCFIYIRAFFIIPSVRAQMEGGAQCTEFDDNFCYFLGIST